MCHSCEMARERDQNVLFKFNVGDKVVKRWKWTRNQYGRYDHEIPIGTIGRIVKIIPDGVIVVDFSKAKFPNENDLGASELDFPKAHERDMNDWTDIRRKEMEETK